MPRSIALFCLAVGLALAGLFLMNLELALNYAIRSHAWSALAVGTMLSIAAFALLFIVAGVEALLERREVSPRPSATQATTTRQRRVRVLLGWPTIIAFALAIGAAGCSKPRVEPVKHVIVDCLKESQDDLLAALLELGTLLSDRDALLSRATELGVPIGGCALAKLIQAHLAPPRGRAAPDPETARRLRATWDEYRTRVAGANTVFHLETGDL